MLCFVHNNAKQLRLKLHYHYRTRLSVPTKRKFPNFVMCHSYIGWLAEIPLGIYIPKLGETYLNATQKLHSNTTNFNFFPSNSAMCHSCIVWNPLKFQVEPTFQHWYRLNRSPLTGTFATTDTSIVFHTIYLEVTVQWQSFTWCWARTLDSHCMTSHKSWCTLW